MSFPRRDQRNNAFDQHPQECNYLQPDDVAGVAPPVQSCVQQSARRIACQCGCTLPSVCLRLYPGVSAWKLAPLDIPSIFLYRWKHRMRGFMARKPAPDQITRYADMLATWAQSHDYASCNCFSRRIPRAWSSARLAANWIFQAPRSRSSTRHIGNRAALVAPQCSRCTRETCRRAAPSPGPRSLTCRGGHSQQGRPTRKVHYAL